MTLANWLKNGWLKPHQSSAQEINDLLSVVDRDLAACQTAGLVTDWRFAIAYNAALQIATAALAVAGYKAERTAHHYRVFQSLEFTLQTDAKRVQKLDVFRKKRNVADYEKANVVSELEADEMYRVAAKLREDFQVWLKESHPALSSK